MDAPTAPVAAATCSPYPGHGKPVGVDLPPPVPAASATPKPAEPKPTTQFDFGKAPSSAPVIAPEPLSTGRAAGAKAGTGGAPWLRAHCAECAYARAGRRFHKRSPRADHQCRSAVQAAQVPVQAEPQAAPASQSDNFDFDFGFNSDGGANGDKPQTEGQQSRVDDAPKSAAASATIRLPI
jgi:hypothetical protein